MFRKKGKQDAIYQANLKRGITSHFARTLKVLQQRHLQSDSDEFIYSDDYSNNLCSSLEAVFLHGLKDSVTQKVSSYVGLAAPQDQSPYMNFWSLCAKFTHKDVITQLRGLSQINTEIGLCRAWIRLALNDGLMESYLHSMMVDKKTLAYHYHSQSYIRDHEQPGILKNFLTGLMSLCFKLSFNSSVLNAWNNTSLQLSGLLEGFHIPGAMLNAKDNVASSSGSGAGLPVERAKVEVENRERIDGNIGDESIVASKRLLRSPSPGYALGGKQPDAMFSSIKDVEEIRRLAVAQNTGSHHSFSMSEGSTSSHISCPDPSSHNIGIEDWIQRDREALCVASPALYSEHGLMSETKSTDEKMEEVISGVSDVLSDLQTSGETDIELSQTSAVTVVAATAGDDVVIAMPQTRPRSRRVLENEEINLSPHSIAMSLSPPSIAIIEEDPIHVEGLVTSDKTPEFFKNSTSPSSLSKDSREFDQTGQAFSDKAIANTMQTSSHSSSNTGKTSPYHPQGRGRTYEEICATLPPIKLDPAEQDWILKKVLGEFDERADKERAERRRIERSASPAPDEYSGSTLKGETKSGSVTTLSSISAEKNITKLPSVFTRQIDDGENRVAKKPGTSSSIGYDSEVDITQADIVNPDKESASGSSTQDGACAGENRPSDNRFIPEENSDATVSEGASAEAVLSQKEVRRLQTHDPSQEDDLLPVTAEKEDAPKNPKDIHRSSSYGNSLNSMLGWSSEIENSQEETKRRSTLKTRAESFASMLKSYAGHYTGINTTLEQVLEGLPSEDDGIDDAYDEDSNQPSDEVAEEDSDLDDFEILSPLPSTARGIQDVDTSRMIYLFRVPREHGLSHQNFTCRGCTRPIGIIYGNPRLCEFDGGLYCFECHENNETHLPSAIIYNWDFGKKKVCAENFKFLQELEHQPLYDVDELNPKLETHVQELKTLKKLRKQLRYLKSYLFSCSQKMAENLRQKVWPREHLYNEFTTYSVSDLFQVQSGALQRFIKDLVKFSSKHVYECSLCCQKGFICEICHNSKVIYPFEVDITIRCEKCKAVFHQTCMTEKLPCPKCARWGRRASQGKVLDDVDGGPVHPEDYGISPPGL